MYVICSMSHQKYSIPAVLFVICVVYHVHVKGV